MRGRPAADVRRVERQLPERAQQPAAHFLVVASVIGTRSARTAPISHSTGPITIVLAARVKLGSV